MLKSLELYGFKSFADRSRFDFSEGVTGVVGPNGSGKSNVVDAMKWLLGDQSAKSLRGKEMADVIFNGSGSRKPAQVAEALLTFDNSTGFLPHEASEVQIGRRLWRSGDSEYLINQEPVRLKDIRNLMSGTGAGGAAYAIIEQGRVGQILQANVSSRRAIFEEAAGISRYKSRKIEAERKLAHVDQNLKRLTDIVQELESQLNATRNQAVKASKYRDLSLELKELWLGQAADDFRILNKQIQETTTRLKTNQQQLNERNLVLQELEKELAESEEQLNAINDRLSMIEQERSQNRENVAGSEATQRHQSKRVRELENDLTLLRHQRSTLVLRAREGHQEHSYTREQLQRFQTDYDSQRKRLDEGNSHTQELSARIANDRLQLDDARKSLSEQSTLLSETKQNVASLQEAFDSFTQKISKTELEQKELEKQLAQEEHELRLHKETYAAHSQQQEACQQELKFLEKEYQEISARHREHLAELNQLRETLSAVKARKTVLEDFELREEGVGLGVREIIKRAQSSDAAPWNSIHGTVADLFEVDLLHAAELEVALGDRAQLIVVEEVAPILNHLYLNEIQLSGRVGFFPLNSSQSTQQTTIDFHGQEGVVARADELVSACPIPELPEMLLANTWLVETLDIALQLQAYSSEKTRFITLQGELLEAEGTVFFGSLRTENSLISRKSELRKLRTDIQQQEQVIQNLTAALNAEHQTLREQEQQKKLKTNELQSQADALAQSRVDLKQSEKKHQELKAEFTAANTEYQQYRLKLAELQEQLEEGQQELNQAEKVESELQSVIEEKEHSLSNDEHRLQLLKQSLTDEQLEMAKQEERLSSLQTAYDRMEQELGQRLEQREEAEKRYKETAAKLSRLRMQILNTNSQLAELALVSEVLEGQAADLMRQKRQCRTDRSEQLEQEGKLRKNRRALSDQVHQDEIRSQEIRLQLDSLTERMSEEYQMTLDEVVASGASAVEHYWLSEYLPTVEQENVPQPVEEFEQPDLEHSEEVDGENIDLSETPELEAIDSAEEQIQEPEQANDINDETPQLTEEIFEEIYEQIKEEVELRVSKLRQRLKSMGSINTESLEQLDNLENRFMHLSTQLEDLNQAQNALEEIIKRINTESRRLFMETYESVRENFQDLFRKLFGGGNGDIVLEDGDDPLESGIEIVARPPGKELRSISLLSGGEKTMTAVALLMAIFRSKPSPFCILDEVDAALDEANIGRFINVIKEFKDETQFIMITHRKPSMTVTDRLFGVTMEESGVSKRLTVQFDNIKENGEFVFEESEGQNLLSSQNRDDAERDKDSGAQRDAA